MRSRFTFEQVEKQLQAFALGVLVDTANMLGKEYKGEFSAVSLEEAKIKRLKVDLYEFRFYNKHASVDFKILNGKVLKRPAWFDIEHKLYSDSPDSSKITYFDENKPLILQFIAELMGNEKPESRFSLPQYVLNRKVVAQ
jgi:hypothetical protein